MSELKTLSYTTYRVDRILGEYEFKELFSIVHAISEPEGLFELLGNVSKAIKGPRQTRSLLSEI